MRIIILTIYLLLFVFSTNGQTLDSSKLNCLVLIDINYKGIVKLYNEKGVVIKELRHNLKEQDYLIINIIGVDENTYEVIASYSISGFIAKGWLKKKNKSIGIYSRAYSSNLKLYRFPEKESQVQCIISKYSPEFYPIKDCKNNWLFIDTKICRKRYFGWMEPNMQCANAYSTCN